MPNTPLDKEDEREQIIESLGNLTVVGKTPHHIRHFLGHSSLGAIADFILADRAAAVRQARIEEAGYRYSNLILNKVDEFKWLRYTEERIEELQSQPNAKELLGMEVKTDDKLPKNAIRFDHQDGRSEGFVLGNAKEEE